MNDQVVNPWDLEQPVPTEEPQKVEENVPPTGPATEPPPQ